MRRITLMTLILSLLLYGRAAAAPNTSARASILQLSDGKVLYQRNSEARMLIASTTKIMTALVVLDNCDPDEVVKVTAASAAVEGSSIYLKPGEELTVEELLYGLLISSGNDAAHALALHVAGSIEAFAELMNKKAAELGLENSSFRNPHGLDQDGHYSTASDLAAIAAKALENELFCEIVATKSKLVAGRSLTNHNRLLWSYKGAQGVKTGYTIAAGRTLVSCAERDGLKLICVTLCAPNDWDDHMKLYDWAFSQYKMNTIAEKNKEHCRVPVISGVSDSAAVGFSEDCRLLLGADDVLETKLRLPKFVYAPVSENDVAGGLEIIVNGEHVKTLSLTYSETVEQDEEVKLNLWGRIKHWWYLGNSQGIQYRMLPY